MTIAVSTGTTGNITVDLVLLWRGHWAQAWSDLGRLIDMRERGEHFSKHAELVFNDGYGGVDYCECFNCRVDRAWRKRHEPIETPKRHQKRRRR